MALSFQQYMEEWKKHNTDDPNKSLGASYVHPFHMIGNIYYVGDLRVCSHLIDTGEGLILLDTGFPRTEFLLFESIWEMGFQPKDIKYILHSHGHGDHYGATEPLVSLFGCKTFIGANDARLFYEHPEAFINFAGTPMKMFVPDVELQDGDIIELGNTIIKAVATPGHSPGVFSYFFDVKESGKTYRAGMFGGAGFNTLYKEAYRKYGYPESTQYDFLHSLDKVIDEKVDVVLENHPKTTFHKRETYLSNPNGPNPFVDEAEWKQSIQALRQRIIQVIEAGY